MDGTRINCIEKRDKKEKENKKINLMEKIYAIR